MKRDKISSKEKSLQMNIENIRYDSSLNNEQLIKLGKETNSKEIRDKVCENNIPLVIKLANKWCAHKNKKDLDDLRSIGLYGLVKAYDTYDVNNGAKFSTYAARVVWGEFCSQYKYERMKCRSGYDVISIDEGTYRLNESTKELTIADIIPDEYSLNDFEEVESKMYIENFLDSSFTENEKYIARRHFIDGFTIAEIGREGKVSRQAVHQTHKRNLKKLSLAIGC
jgi:RNA polymerase sporulation-specific sigma factor